MKKLVRQGPGKIKHVHYWGSPNVLYSDGRTLPIKVSGKISANTAKAHLQTSYCQKRNRKESRFVILRSM